MELNKIELAARKYANITHNKEIDDKERYYQDYQKYDGFIAGYKQAIEDSKATEMFEMLKVAKSTIQSLRLSMSAHPDYEVDSEFYDYVDLADEKETDIQQLLIKITK